MSGLSKYIHKTTLGLVTVHHDNHVGTRRNIIQVHRIALYTECEVSLYVDGVYLDDLSLNHIGISPFKVRNWDSSTWATWTSSLPNDRLLRHFYFVTKRKSVLQMFVRGLPAITVTDWTGWEDAGSVVITDRWLELDNPEVVQLCQDLLNT